MTVLRGWEEWAARNAQALADLQATQDAYETGEATAGDVVAARRRCREVEAEEPER